MNEGLEGPEFEEITVENTIIKHPDKSMECKVCHKTYSVNGRAKLSDHIMIKHMYKYKVLLPSLMQAMIFNCIPYFSVLKPYVCTLCGESFSANHWLTSHKKNAHMSIPEFSWRTRRTRMLLAKYMKPEKKVISSQ